MLESKLEKEMRGKLIRIFKSNLNFSQSFFGNKTLLKYLLIGLAIRFILAPITMHGDMVLWVTTAQQTIDAKLIIYAIPEIKYPYPPLWLWFSSAIYFFWRIVYPSASPLMPLDTHLFTSSAVGFLVNKPLILFLKIPLILTDVLVGYLIFAIVTKYLGEKWGCKAFILWFLNPFVIFIDAIWGHFDVLAAACAFFSLYLFVNNKYWKSALSLGFGVVCKSSPLLLLPYYIAIMLKLNLKKSTTIIFALFTFVPLILISLPYLVISPMGYITHLFTYSQSFLLGFNLGYIPVTFTLLIVALLAIYDKWNLNNPLRAINAALMLPLLIYFALSIWHPQFFIWIIPFLTIDAILHPKRLYLFKIVILLALVWSFIVYWPPYYFFYPIYPDIFQYPTLRMLQQPSEKLMTIIWGTFSGSCIWYIYLIFRDFFIKKSN